MNLVDKNNLVNLLNKVMKQTGKQTSDTEIIFLCPFHTAHNNKDRKKFGISLDGQYNCFACGESGKSFKTLFKKLKASPSHYKELYSIIGEHYKPNYGKIKENTNELKLPDEFLSMAIPNKSLEYRHAFQYLKKRGITRDDILRYNIGYCEQGLYRNRIIIPSYDKDAKLNFFSARDFLNTSYLKYLLPPWSKDIIGFELFINWQEPVTLVESSFNAISIRNNSIPLFGKIIPNALKEAMLEYDVKRVNMCLDNDAEKESLKLCDNLLKLSGVGIEVHFVELPLKDPNEIGFEKMTGLIKNSPIADYSYLFKRKINL